MNFYFSTIILYLNLNFLKAPGTTATIHTCVYNLHVYNDGPVILDVPVSISAFLECADEDEEHVFVFEFDRKQKIVLPGHQTAGTSHVFTDYPGNKVVHVRAYILFPERVRIASGSTTVEVHEYIPGSLEFFGPVVEEKEQRYIAAGDQTNISIDLHYPKRIFDESEFSYSWTIGESRFISDNPYLVHRFLEPGPQWIRAAVVARIPSYGYLNITRFKWGYFDSKIIVKKPFNNFNITGNTYLQHGQLLNLDISCSGSGPVDYCWKVLPPLENQTNLSCSEPVSVLECSFPIIYYFQDSGDFLLAIYVDNIVSFKQRNIEIHIYDVSLRPQLSTVIIPVVCTVLVLVILVVAIVVHVRRKANYDIETADFDFMVTDEARAIFTETSWEYMLRTFFQLLRIPYIYYKTEMQLANYGTVIHER